MQAACDLVHFRPSSGSLVSACWPAGGLRGTGCLRESPGPRTPLIRRPRLIHRLPNSETGLRTPEPAWKPLGLGHERPRPLTPWTPVLNLTDIVRSALPAWQPAQQERDPLETRQPPGPRSFTLRPLQTDL